MAVEQELCTVTLRGLPLDMLARAREHSDDLMREFALIAVRDADTTSCPSGLWSW